MEDLIIIGSGGFAREVAWLVQRMNAVNPAWNILGFMDNDPELIGKVIDGIIVLDEADAYGKYADASYVCAIGKPAVRKQVVAKYKDLHFATLIDPNALISERTAIGDGTIICAGNIITVDVSIGSHVIVNLGCTIGHDAVIHDFVTLYPSVNVSGITEIGRCSEVGTGTKIIQMKKIGNYSIVGAGAVVVKDIPDNCTAVGVPAKPIRKNSDDLYNRGGVIQKYRKFEIETLLCTNPIGEVA